MGALSTWLGVSMLRRHCIAKITFVPSINVIFVHSVNNDEVLYFIYIYLHKANIIL